MNPHPSRLSPRSAVTEEQRAWISGARNLVDFLESRPELLGDYMTDLHLVRHAINAETLAELTSLLGAGEKTSSERYIGVVRRFGPHRLEVFAAHDTVCERVDTVVTEEVTEPDPELLAQVPLVTRTVERVETSWVCPDSLLRAAKEHYAEQAEMAEATSS